jgi:hypothetical protein
MTAIRVEDYDRVLADRVPVKATGHQREIVQVQATGIVPRGNWHERMADAVVGGHVRSGHQPLDRREIVNLIWIARRGDVDDASLVVDDESRRVGQP